MTAKASRRLEPDICVIGAGSAGLSLAAGAAAFGRSVVLVERARMGGDCLNVGCVPSKALIAAARQAAHLREAAAFGIEAGPVRVDFARVRRHIADTIAAIAPFDSVARFESLGVQVLQAEARFLDERTVAAGDRLIRARRFVIATGSRPRIPAIPGLAALGYHTNETIFDLEACPERLLVLGGGAIGMELAQAYRRLGAEVDVVEAGQVLSREDPELTAPLLARFASEGLRIREGAQVSAAEPSPSGIRLHVAGGGPPVVLEGTHLLVATGRRPDFDSLNLAAAGIETDERGLRVSAALRTTNRRVYAIGDIAGGPQLTHLAAQQAGLVLRQILFRLPVRQRLDRLPRAIFTDPELAQIGWTEAEARAADPAVTVVRWSYRENDRAWTERRTEGLVKLVAGRNGRLLGAGIVGEGAAEMANLFALALSRSMRLRDLAGFVSPYPTYGEIGKRAATAYLARYARHGLVRALVAGLARLG